MLGSARNDLLITGQVVQLSRLLCVWITDRTTTFCDQGDIVCIISFDKKVGQFRWITVFSIQATTIVQFKTMANKRWAEVLT